MVSLKQFSRTFNLLITKIILSNKLRKRADKYFNKTIGEFKKEHNRKPDRNEIFLLVVKASHRTLGIKSSRKQRLKNLGHTKRQWIRKYLLLKYRIRDNFKIQEARTK